MPAVPFFLSWATTAEFIIFQYSVSHLMFLCQSMSLFCFPHFLFLSPHFHYLFFFSCSESITYTFYSSTLVFIIVLALCVCVCVLVAQSWAIPWAVPCQAPLSMGFYRQEYKNNCHALLQGIFPTQGSNLGLLYCRQTLYCLSHQGSLCFSFSSILKYIQCSPSVILLNSPVIYLLDEDCLWGDFTQG